MPRPGNTLSAMMAPGDMNLRQVNWSTRIAPVTDVVEGNERLKSTISCCVSVDSIDEVGPSVRRGERLIPVRCAKRAQCARGWPRTRVDDSLRIVYKYAVSSRVVRGEWVCCDARGLLPAGKRNWRKVGNNVVTCRGETPCVEETSGQSDRGAAACQPVVAWPKSHGRKDLRVKTTGGRSQPGRRGAVGFRPLVGLREDGSGVV